MRRVFILGCIGLLLGMNWLRPSATSGQSAATLVVSNLSNPVFAGHAPGDSSRLFLLEQGSGGTARIKTYDFASGAVSTYMTITGLQTGGERGLLGLAFHPDFANNGQFFVNVTTANQTRIQRYTATGDPLTSTTANQSTLQDVLRFNQPFSNHNGGWIGFDPTSSDPYLYIATGDGGSGGDPQNNSQDITSNLLGKMLRVNVDVDDFPSSTSANYGIPATNPFVDAPGDDEIWSYGLRNPYRNSFDRATGDLWIADVGQNIREEINYQAAGSAGGENYGWRVREGTNCFDNSQAGGNPNCLDPSLVDPIYEYNHNSGSFGGFSVTGGYVYHGSVDRFQGQYFFGDFSTDNVWTLDPYAVNVAASVLNRNGVLPENVGSWGGVSSFGEDADGELYLVSYFGSQSVYKITSTARVAEWNGNTSVGAAGNGTSWSDANNWTRDGVVDSAVLTQDTVVFLPAAAPANVDLQTAQTVSAVRVEGDYRLLGGSLRVLSGNITVTGSSVATVDSALLAESGNRSIRKRGSGTLLINSTSNQIAVLEGTLGGNGTVDHVTVYIGGNVAPGISTGSLNVTNTYRQQSGAILAMEIGGATPVTEYDQLLVGGAAEIAGELALEAFGGYTPTLELGQVESYDVLVAGSLEGTFDVVSLDGTALVPLDGGSTPESFISYAGDGLFQRVAYSSTTVTFDRYQALAGDANGDGSVDTLDLAVWFDNRFTTGTDWLTADFNGDGVTDVSDFNIWNANRGSSVTAVPEPSCVWLLVGWGLLWLPRIVRPSVQPS